jgi:hypothetical protein
MEKVRQESLVSRINDVLATRITFLVGSIWAFYAFVIFGLTPVLCPDYEQAILYWSNFLQLIFLPIITVGTAVMNRDSERGYGRPQNIRKEFDLMREIHQGDQIVAGIHSGVASCCRQRRRRRAARLGRERKGGGPVGAHGRRGRHAAPG